MKLEFQSRWLRLLLELPPELSSVRRYRVTPASLDGSASRLLRRQIAQRMRTPKLEELP